MNAMSKEKLRDKPHSTWYADAMEHLVEVVQQLSLARDMESVIAIVREEARNLTGADGATFVLRDEGKCYYVDENAISPLWKGRRFPMDSCISGWVMQNAQSAVIEDIYRDDRIPADAYRPTFVKSLAMVPIRRSCPIGAIGNYWAKKRKPTEDEVAVLQALADTTSVAMENVQLYDELQSKITILEKQKVRIHDQRNTLELFTRALAHDLKEPVRSIQSFSELIQDEVSTRKGDEYFRYIQNAANRMGMLVESVFHYLQLDSPEELPKEQTDVTETVEGAKERLAQLIRETGAVITQTRLPKIMVYSPHLMQVLQNLISNAIIHCGERKPNIHISAEEREAHWQFSVRDNGPGIPQEKAKTIFQPFKRLTKAESCSGLGLAICQKIVESNGGSIWCESKPGQGATFFFTLPKVTTMESDIVIIEETVQPTGEPKQAMLANLLLVDDAESDIELARIKLFKRAGLQCNLLIATDSKEALDILQETAQRGEQIDLVLLDINIPGMNGFELLEYIRNDELLKDIKVAICTGSIYERDRKRAESLGVMGYIVKPPSFDMFKLVLDRIPTLKLYRENGTKKLLRISDATNPGL